MATSISSFTNLLSFLSAPPPSSSTRPTQLPLTTTPPQPPSSLALGRRTDAKLVCNGRGTGYNVEVEVEEDEPDDRLVGRFRREVIQAGVFREIMRRRWHENKRDKKKRKIKEAARRNSMSRRGPYRPRFEDPEEAEEPTKKDDDGDNWELPEGADLPY